ncbi:MAG: hypothetical protein ACREYE_22785 [Gammaproteobacteria bacterium]
MANEFSNDVSAIDVNFLKEIARITAGNGPRGIATSSSPRERR